MRSKRKERNILTKNAVKREYILMTILSGGHELETACLTMASQLLATDRPLCSQRGCESDSCEHSERQRCDSVVGDGSWIFREFVTYNHHPNYPEYLITYERV